MLTHRIVTLLLGSLFLTATAIAQEPDPDRPRWLRYPAISPDGSQIAFVYAGQIWLVPSQGGEAVALTGAPYYSSHPVWSPDGSRIAFSSDRYGNADIFVMPVAGGPIQRLSHYMLPDTPMAFSPDGSELYFSSARLGDPQADVMDSHKGLGWLFVPQLYGVPSQGGRVRRLLPTSALDVAVSDDGGQWLYTSLPTPLENEWRKHQVSDAARDIWIYQPDSGEHRQLTDWRGEDRNAVWSPDGNAFLWLSERGGSFNVWRRAVDGGEAEQITQHEQWPVRFLSSADDGTLAYAYDGDLWRLDAGAEQSQRVAVSIRQGNLVDGAVPLAVNDQATEMVVSPDGKTLALVARGDVFVVSTVSGSTRRITDSTAAERDVSFAPDGRGLIYASERNGDWDLYTARLTQEADSSFVGAAPFAETVILDTDADTYQPRYASDGARVGYRHERAAIRVLDTDTGESIEVLAPDAVYSYYDGDVDFAWGPDGQWLVTRTGFESSAEVVLLDAHGVEPPVNLSLNGFLDLEPQVSPDGQAILWLSDRNGLRATNSTAAQVDVYGAFLSWEAYDHFRASGEERLRMAELSAAQDASPAPGDEAADSEAEGGGGLPDIAGIQWRTGRLTPFSTRVVFYALTPDNRRLILVADKPDGTTAGYAVDLSSNSATTLFTRPTLPPSLPSPVYTTDGAVSTLYVLAAGGLTRYDLTNGQAAPLAFRAEVSRDVRQEVAYLFDHNWRMTKKTFYRPDMQGVDWDAVGEHYRQFLPHIIHWEDLAELMNEMVGELNASHQGSRFANASPTGDQTASLGLYYDQTHLGAGMGIEAVLPGGPADRPASALQAGAVILAVDGVEITPAMHIHQLLNRRAGQPVLLTIQPADGGEPVTQTVTTLNILEENELAYQRWMARRRAMVERLSDGRIGYVHVKGMALEPYQYAYGELFGRYRDAEAVVVDIRANGGGNLHDQLVTMLTGSHDSRLMSRDGVVVTRNPVGRFTRPSALLVNASSYSDASVFPTLYKQKGIGAVVGERVPGTGTAVVRPPQMEPRLSYGIPELGFQLTDGTWFENFEVVPDILVYNDPASVTAGEDKQLEAAVQHLLEVLDGG